MEDREIHEETVFIENLMLKIICMNTFFLEIDIHEDTSINNEMNFAVYQPSQLESQKEGGV